MENKKIIIFDFNRTLYDPDKKEVISGSVNLLEKLKLRGDVTILISRKEGDKREFLVSDVGLDKYFDEMLFVENKSEEIFRKIFEKYSSENFWVVGDYLYEEICFGNMVGMKTIWIKNGKFRNLKPRNENDIPSFAVCSIDEAGKLLIQ